MKTLWLTIALTLLPVVALAQTVINPQTAVFAHSDTDFAATLSYHVEFFACTAVAAGVCQGQAATPFQAAPDIAKANVTTVTPPNADGTNRSFSLTAANVTGALAAMPVGTAFVATVTAIGDPNVGAGPSGRSAASNPFFPSAQAVGGVQTLKVK